MNGEEMLIKIIKRTIKLFIPEKIYMRLQRFFRIKIKKNTTKNSRLHIVVHISDQCNLSCKSCSHFSPLACGNNLDPAEYENDIVRIKELTDDISTIALLGGEPLLNHQIEKFADITRKYFPHCQLQITTNGILLVKQPESFWINCNKNNVNIMISQYPIKLNAKEIFKLAKRYNVNIKYLPRGDFFKIKLDLHGSQEVDKSFRKCLLANYCIELSHGRIYTCCIAAHINDFNLYFNKNIAITDKDYIDIYKTHNIDDILSFLAKPIPFCRYCDWNKIENNIGWSPSKKEISEWT
jgi:MoaA/NifB/PqqE/SkfB family radical SAM enzyme